ncbi:MAG TPA: Spx/MgsR family RNA polymerase-binding regulatory protein [Polyangiaceae bacterium]|nr:Spx/MgsR family RNA polymerase-binding regulatory protein [Polyangiaceae bacterium]
MSPPETPPKNHAPVTLFEYAACSTCRKAKQWLERNGVGYESVPIVVRPPSVSDLEELVARSGLPISKWFNTSGQSYRALVARLGKDGIAKLDDAAKLRLLAADGKMIKRPILVAQKTVLVGFDESAYARSVFMSEPNQVEKGKVVTIKYRLTGEDGKLLDESGDEGMDYLHGANNIVPGLEKKMGGRSVGDKLAVVVSPEDGYGKRVGGSQKVPRDSFPDDVDVEVGMEFLAEGPRGKPMPVWVVGMSDTEIEIDANHPLAGATLHFEVEVLAVRAASAEERSHGHPHGPDGHHHH